MDMMMVMMIKGLKTAFVQTLYADDDLYNYTEASVGYCSLSILTKHTKLYSYVNVEIVFNLIYVARDF